MTFAPGLIEAKVKMFIYKLTISSCASVRMSRYHSSKRKVWGVRVALVADGKAKLYRYIRLSTS